MRHGEHREIERGIHQPPRLVGHDVTPTSSNSRRMLAGLRRPGRVVIAGDQHDRRAGQRLAKPLELPEGEDDRGVGGPDGMEEIAGDDDGIGTGGDHAVDGERGTPARRRPRAG